MSTRATGTFEIKSWDEKPYEEFESGVKLVQASVAQTFRGDIEAESGVEYLMTYSNDGIAYFVGMQSMVGSIGDRSGNFALQVRGTYEGEVARATWFVVPGSGSGGLQGLIGEGGYSADKDGNVVYTLDYSFD